jgi:alpha-galactosidase
MSRVKIVAVGAASASFGLTILRDIIACRDLDGSELALVDVNEEGLELMRRVGTRMAECAGSSTRVWAVSDPRDALPDASYVIVSVAVARLDGWRMDWEVPLGYGIKQVLAENGGVGGLFQLLRNLPPIMNVARAMESLCPDALLMNFSNPVPRVVHAVSRYTQVRAVGLCHGLENVRSLFSRWLDMPTSEIYLRAAGINHFTWILEARRRGSGEDLYPRLRELCFSHNPPPEEPLCQALFRRFGYFPTCGDNHTGEFLPSAMVEEVHPFPWEPPDDWPQAYVERADRPYGWVGWPWRFEWENSARTREQTREFLRRLADGEEDPSPLLATQPHEYALRIILSIEKNEDWLCPAINAPNVTATGGPLIANTPPVGVVEVAAVVNASGVQPLPVPDMPVSLAAFVSQQVLIQELAAKAAVEGDVEAALRALALEPCVGSLEAARGAFADLVAAERQWLPQFAGEI